MAANEEEMTDEDLQGDELDGVVAALGDNGDDTAAPVPDEDGDSYADVFAEDAEGERPRDDQGRFAKKADPPPDPAKPAEATTEAPSADGASSLPPVDPFAEWAPFTFKADGVEATLDGVRANDTHVVIPRQVWDEQFRPNYLANRGAWQEERNQYRQQVQQAAAFARQAAEERTAREARAEAIIGEFDKLLTDPDTLTQFLADFERNAPILRAQIEAQEARQQLDQYNRQMQQQQASQEYEQTFQRGADAYEQACIDILKDPKYAGLATNDDERDELLAELWDVTGKHAVLIADRDYPEHGLRRGEITVNREALTEVFDRRAAFLAKRLAKATSVTTAEQRNAARVASPATSPQTAKPAVRSAKPAPASNTRRKAPEPVHAVRITDEDRDEWDADYRGVFDE